MRRSLLLAFALFGTSATSGAAFAESAPPADSVTVWDHAACAENVVVGRILETHGTASSGCVIDPRVFCHVEIVDVLQGSIRPGKVQGWFEGTFWSPLDSRSSFGGRYSGLAGKLALLFPESCGMVTVMKVRSGLPGDGAFVLQDANDPAIERMRNAIRQGSLDTLIAHADAVCLGGYRYGQFSDFVVRRWITGGSQTNMIRIREEGAGQPGKVLMFLARDAWGRLRPIGNGRGELAVRHGRVLRLDRKLDDVLREICERRPCPTTLASLP